MIIVTRSVSRQDRRRCPGRRQVAPVRKPPQRHSWIDRPDHPGGVRAKAVAGREGRGDAALGDHHADWYAARDLRKPGRDPSLAEGVEQRRVARPLGRDHRKAIALQSRLRFLCEALNLGLPNAHPRALPRAPSGRRDTAARAVRSARSESRRTSPHRTGAQRAPTGPATVAEDLVPVRVATNAGAQRTNSEEPSASGSEQPFGDDEQIVALGLGIGDDDGRAPHRGRRMPSTSATASAPSDDRSRASATVTASSAEKRLPLRSEAQWLGTRGGVRKSSVACVFGSVEGERARRLAPVGECRRSSRDPPPEVPAPMAAGTAW